MGLRFLLVEMLECSLCLGQTADCTSADGGKLTARGLQ